MNWNFSVSFVSSVGTECGNVYEFSGSTTTGYTSISAASVIHGHSSTAASSDFPHVQSATARLKSFHTLGPTAAPPSAYNATAPNSSIVATIIIDHGNEHHFFTNFAEFPAQKGTFPAISDRWRWHQFNIINFEQNNFTTTGRWDWG